MNVIFSRFIQTQADHDRDLLHLAIIFVSEAHCE